MSSVTESAAEGRKTILFVDDEPLSLKYFKASVGRYANVVTATSPRAALEILAAEGDAISVVVSDERMPHDSGVSFLSSVRKSWPSTVRVLTSAYANIENLQEAINAAAVHRFVPKPWNIDELCSAMRDALEDERADAEMSTGGREVSGPSDVQSASIELLSVLSRELAEPLVALDTATSQLANATGAWAQPTQEAQTPISAWSTQLRRSQIAESIASVRKEADRCKALTCAIAELAVGLSGTIAPKRASMADTAARVLETLAMCGPHRNRITLDAQQDFLYCAPVEVMRFVLKSLVQRTLDHLAETSATIALELVPSSDSNEVRITAASRRELKEAASDESARASRCALWAFGGELSFSIDKNLGTVTTCVRLPRADVSPSR